MQLLQIESGYDLVTFDYEDDTQRVNININSAEYDIDIDVYLSFENFNKLISKYLEAKEKDLENTTTDLVKLLKLTI